jgi:hypothetical protein
VSQVVSISEVSRLNCICISHLPHTCYMSHPSNFSWLITLIMSGEQHEAPHHAIFSIFLLLPFSQFQVELHGHLMFFPKWFRYWVCMCVCNSVHSFCVFVKHVLVPWGGVTWNQPITHCIWCEWNVLAKFRIDQFLIILGLNFCCIVNYEQVWKCRHSITVLVLLLGFDLWPLK